MEVLKLNLYNFQSTYKNYMNYYVNMMISKGYKEYSFYYIYRFDSFLIQNNYNLDYISKEIIDKWSIKLDTEEKNTRNDRVVRVNGFCRYLNSIGIKAYISFSKLSRNTTTPYVLSKDEIIKLFDVIDKESQKIKLVKHYSFMLPVFYRLLYTCGLRNSEACCLKINDVDLSNSKIKIYCAKNNKDRIVYISDDMCKLLNNYIFKIKHYITSEWLFPSSNYEKHILKTTIDKYFNSFVKILQIGTYDFHPVPHSLRHTYVIHRVDSWIQEGKDVNSLIIYLSKQLGHNSLNETYYYYHTLESSFKPINEKSRKLYPEVTMYEE